jgi:hypothetical protein
MATPTKATSWFNFYEDVTMEWSGGRNITWRMTHGPTGISVEGSTNLRGSNFTKQRLRVADRQLMAKLLRDLERLVIQHYRRGAGERKRAADT